jgi:hypothetical protein
MYLCIHLWWLWVVIFLLVLSTFQWWVIQWFANSIWH